MQTRITQADIDAIRDTAQKSILFKDIPHNAYFGNIYNFVKLTAILEMDRDYKTLNSITEAVGEFEILRDLAALEILLGLKSSTNSAEGASGNVRLCIALFNQDSDTKVENLDSLHLGYSIVLAKHAALSGIRPLVKAIFQAHDPSSRLALAAFLSSFAITSANYLDRMNLSENYKPWITYCKTITTSKVVIRADEQNDVLQALALFQTKDRAYIDALKTAKQLSPPSPHLTNLIRMQFALSEGKFERASSFADRMISQTQIMPSGRFQRDLAEYALRRANKVLRDANLKPILIAGTLLGLVREGRIFDHDKDFDLGIIGWEDQFAVAEALLRSGEFTVNLKNLIGQGLFLLPVRHTKTGYDFDIFFYHPQGETFRLGIDSRLGYQMFFDFSAFDIKEATFFDETFYIPSQYERLLDENYGTDWRTPNPNYFVKLQSPALVRSDDALFGFIARHEMLDLISRKGSLKKAEALIACIEQYIAPSHRPSAAIVKDFLKAVSAYNS